MMIHPVLAARLAVEVRMQPKECYRNAVLALLHFATHRAEYQRFFEGEVGEVTYVEGVLSIMDGSLHIDHGWLEVGEVIVDVTVNDQQPGDYQAVLRYTAVEAWEHLDRAESLPFFAHDRAARKEIIDALQRRYAATHPA